MLLQDDSDLETHQERLERLKAAAVPPPEGKPARKKKSSKAKKAKELKEGGILKRAGGWSLMQSKDSARGGGVRGVGTRCMLVARCRS